MAAPETRHSFGSVSRSQPSTIWPSASATGASVPRGVTTPEQIVHVVNAGMTVVLVNPGARPRASVRSDPHARLSLYT